MYTSAASHQYHIASAQQQYSPLMARPRCSTTPTRPKRRAPNACPQNVSMAVTKPSMLQQNKQNMTQQQHAVLSASSVDMKQKVCTAQIQPSCRESKQNKH
jgi:hypothetical protein